VQKVVPLDSRLPGASGAETEDSRTQSKNKKQKPLAAAEPRVAKAPKRAASSR
jgi:hypothetical protein